MPFALMRLWRRLGRLSWLVPVGVVLVVFLSSWALMAIAEPEADLVRPENFWWYFLITSSTVGYGDLFPVTVPGRLVAAYVVFGGITTLTMIFARVATALENTRSRRMQGLTSHRHRGHVVVIGYTPARTERIITDLLSDSDRDLVICAWDDQTAQHPMPSEPRVHFVRGDLTDEEVLDRANIAAAHAVLVDARDDNEAVSVAIAAERAATGVHTVVALRDLERRRTVAKVDPTAHCLQWHSVTMIVEELQDPGIGLVYQELSNAGGVSTYSTVLPAESPELSYGDWQQALGREYGATVLAMQLDGQVRVSPGWRTSVPAGSTLYYVSARRLAPDQLVAASRQHT